MPQYEQKTDSREFEVANPHQSQGPWRGDARADATDIVVRLWGPKRSDRSAPLTWKTDSVLIYMIADLVGASHGRIAEESPAIMGAHFDGSGQAMVAAKRIQTSILEFLVCRGRTCRGRSPALSAEDERHLRLQRRDCPAGAHASEAGSDLAR